MIGKKEEFRKQEVWKFVMVRRKNININKTKKWQETN